MSNINGLDNEYEFVKALNGKQFFELNNEFRNLLKFLYPNITENTKISCFRNHYQQKSDIIIRVDGLVKGISIKKGYKNSVHVERLSDFIHFLISNGVSREVVIAYLKYHFGDGTTNGKGKERVSSEIYKVNHADEIAMINNVFNDKNLVRNAIKKFVTMGNNSNFFIDALVYGEVDDFLWISVNDIENIILSKTDIFSSGIHFGGLHVQPKNRCLNYNLKYEKDRFCVQIKWYNIKDDILEYKSLFDKLRQPS